jgi:hypothetical protein
MRAPDTAVVEPKPWNEVVEFLEPRASPHLQFLKLNQPTRAQAAAVVEPPQNQLAEFPNVSASPHLQFLKLNHARTALRQVNLAVVHY